MIMWWSKEDTWEEQLRWFELCMLCVLPPDGILIDPPYLLNGFQNYNLAMINQLYE